jgi:hypothetical protein
MPVGAWAADKLILDSFAPYGVVWLADLAVRAGVRSSREGLRIVRKQTGPGCQSKFRDDDGGTRTCVAVFHPPDWRYESASVSASRDA